MAEMAWGFDDSACECGSHTFYGELGESWICVMCGKEAPAK